MTYYVYRQNNSGGYFTGPPTIIVRATDVDTANRIARSNGVDPDAPYCECCGRRWTLLDDDPIDGFQAVDDLDDLDDYYLHGAAIYTGA